MSGTALYRPSDRPMRVAVLFSGGASGLRYLLDRDAQLGEKYTFVVALTDRDEASGIEIATEAGIPLEILDYREFTRNRDLSFRDPDARQAYYARALERIERWEPDLLMLSGFMLIVTDPLLSRYRYRILNVHPADLTIVDEGGRRKYTGMDAVARAMEAGETRTRSTVHLVTEDVDGGPIVALSDPLPVEEGISPEEQQERMKWHCDGPAYQRAIRRIATGKVSVDWESGSLQIAG